MARIVCPEPGSQLTLQSWTGENLVTPPPKKGDYFGNCWLCGGWLLWYVDHPCPGRNPTDTRNDLNKE